MSTLNQHMLQRFAILVLTFGTLNAALGQAPSDNCENDYSCDWSSPSGVYSVCAGGLLCYTASPTPSFTPDRRPGFFRNTQGGTISCTNPKGQANFWLNANWSGSGYNFRERLDTAFDAGFRRIMLNIPGGKFSDQFWPQAQYWHLTDDQKDLLNDTTNDGMPNYNPNGLAAWIDDAEAADSDFEVGVIIGSWQSGNVCTPCLWPGSNGNEYWDCSNDFDTYNDNTRIFDPESQSSMEEAYLNIDPWMDMGLTAIWFDNGSNPTEDGPRRVLDFRQSPNYSSIKIGGEAIPRDSNDDINYNMANYAAWYCHYRYVDFQGWLTGGANPQTITNPENTELIIIFGNPDGTPEYTLATMADARDRGFVVWVSYESVISWLQRLYDGENNEFYNAFSDDMADFDADGDVDCDDYNTFMANWAANTSSMSDDNFSIWDGDINNDDYVNTTDLLAFLGLADWTSCP